MSRLLMAFVVVMIEPGASHSGLPRAGDVLGPPEEAGGQPLRVPGRLAFPERLFSCTALLARLVPLLIETMLDHPETLWGEACYPVVECGGRRGSRKRD